MNEKRAQREVRDFLELFVLDGDPPALADVGEATGLDPNEFAQAWDAASKALKLLSALPPLRAREEIARLPAKLMQIADGALDDPADEAVVRDAADALVRLLSLPAGEWRDISSAPKDGTPVDVWCPSDGDVGGYRITDTSFGKPDHECMSQYCDSCPPDRTVKKWREPMGSNPIKPTHWMPRPAPPVAEPIVAEKSQS